jgi:hypothetical protein
MAHFAELDKNNIVTRVIVVHNNELLDENGIESEQKGIDFCIAHYGGTWIQTSYNGNFRGQYAAIGAIYNPVLDGFIGEKPYESWLLNEDTCRWEAPIAYPTDGKNYFWDEENLLWVEAKEEFYE